MELKFNYVCVGVMVNGRRLFIPITSLLAEYELYTRHNNNNNNDDDVENNPISRYATNSNCNQKKLGEKKENDITLVGE